MSLELGKSIEDLLNEADEKLKNEGIDPNGRPIDNDEGSQGGLSRDVNEDDDSTEEENSETEEESTEKDDESDTTLATATDENGKGVTFGSAEELANFVKSQKEVIEDKDSTKEEKKSAKEALESMKFFEDDFKPKDWNEAMRLIITNARPILKQMDEEESEQAKSRIKSVNDRLDREYDEIAKANSLPDRTTAEGLEVDRQLAVLASVYQLPSYKQAFDMWSKLPKDTVIKLANGKEEKVGGLNYQPPVEKKAEPKPKVNPSKAASRRLGSSSAPESSAAKKKVDYSRIHGKSMDQLAEDWEE